MAGVELATAWVRLVPSMENATDSIVKSLAPGTAAAEKEGTKAGKGWSSNVKKAIGAAAIGGAVVGAFKGLYSVGDTFDTVTDTIRVGTGAQGEALTGLVDVAKSVGKQVPAEFEQVGTTVADLNTRLGLSGETLDTVAQQYLEAGRILGQDVDIASTSAAFSAFKIEGDAVVGAMDSLFQVSQATGVGMNDLASGAQQNGVALQELGFGFEDSISLLGSLDKAGLNANGMMSGLSRSLVNLAKDGEQPADAFQRVIGEMQGYIDKGDSAAALDIAGSVFGTRNAAQFIGALQSGVLSMDDLMAATGATGDTILGVGEETMSFSERWQQTMNTGMTALEPLATGLFTALSDGLTAAMPTLQALGEWVSQNTGTIGVIAGVIGVTLVAAMVAWTASIWASTIALLANPVTWIILAIIALVAAVVLLVMRWDEVVAFISDIWGSFVDWLVAVGDGIATWWNDLWGGIGQWIRDVWDGFITWITDVWSGFIGWLQGIGDGIATWWNGLWSGIGQWIRDVWDGFTSWVREKFEFWVAVIQGVGALYVQWWNDFWSGIGNFIRDIWNGFTSWVREKFELFLLGVRIIGDAIASWWHGLWSGIGSFVADTWNGFIGWVQGIFGGFASWIRGVGDGIASWWNGLWSGIGGFFESVFGGLAGFAQSAFNNVVGAIKAPINGIIGLVNGAISGLNSLSVTIPDWVPAVGGQTWGLSLPQIPYLAKGATILPRSGGTLAVLAEAGRPESVVDTGLMNRALEEGLAGEDGSGMTVQGALVHIEHMTVDSDRRVEEVSRDLHQRIQRAERARGKVNLGGAVTA
ncbi:phage tail tape measure protein [Microbacterium karelineae]|uniref:phage tail tape measure protein n=1 Tax=Microbacterium karelineae TaxID=2654283 RepID=UPI0012EA3428|nr:phage tail tape measure protein [Microbacterium karelineae]